MIQKSITIYRIWVFSCCKMIRWYGVVYWMLMSTFPYYKLYSLVWTRDVQKWWSTEYGKNKVDIEIETIGREQIRRWRKWNFEEIFKRDFHKWNFQTSNYDLFTYPRIKLVQVLNLLFIN